MNYNAHGDAHQHPGRHDGLVVKRSTDRHVTVKCHGHKYIILHASERMDQKHLGHTSAKVNLMGIKPEDAQHAGHSGCTKGQISRGKEGQKVEHGLLEGLLHLDD